VARRKTYVVDLHLVVRRGGEILLGLRRDTGFADGMFHLPAGHLEDGEALLQGAVREAREQLGNAIAERDVMLVHVLHHNTGRIAFFFVATRWAGDATNCEPDKCTELRWFSPHRLPDNVVPYARVALVMMATGRRLSSFDWRRQ
jgi:ADP-ribose pyrophosphatase YjhB (NUDIX family)